MKKNIFLTGIMLFLLFLCYPVDTMANDYNCHAPDSYPKGHWIEQWKKKGSIYSDLKNSYIHVVESSGTSYYGAIANAEKKAEEQADKGGNGGGTVRGPKYDLAVHHKRLGEYCEFEDGTYTVYLLYQTAKDPSYNLEPLSTTYPKDRFSARIFVPGMAQIYKGQTVKGTLFIAGEALFIGGIAASFGVSAHYKDRHNNETNSERRNKYGDWANAAYYTGWTFVGLAAALYIANIIDGAVSQPGDFALFDENGKRVAFVPTATFDSVGLAMNLNF